MRLFKAVRPRTNERRNRVKRLQHSLRDLRQRWHGRPVCLLCIRPSWLYGLSPMRRVEERDLPLVVQKADAAGRLTDLESGVGEAQSGRHAQPLVH